MNTLTINVAAKDLKFTEEAMLIYFTDGRELKIPIAYFPRLLKATMRQRMNFVIGGGGTSIHWDELDEGINVKNLLLGFGDTTKQSGFIPTHEAA